LKGVPLGPYSAKRDFKVYDVIVGHSLAMASIRNDEQGAFGAMSGHDRKTLSLSVKVSNPERVIDPSTGLTKLDLVRYYESIAEWMIPHLKGRPVSLVRAPSGIAGQQFFQKHDDKLSIPGLRELDPALWECYVR